VANLYCI